jgi:glyoxylase-like metal-dependent hydrolase (beta-lactamase superfamily II)/dienelactone hydrolase
MAPFLRTLVAAAAWACAAGNLSAQEPITTLRSAVEGRRVMDDVFTAVGGRQALRAVRSIETEETIRRINGGQGQRPSSPDTGYGRRVVSVDVPGQRIAELRVLGIRGNQLADFGRFFTPKASTVVNWPNMTRDSIPQANVPQARAAFARRNVLPFLQGLERLPPAATRWLGITPVDGTPHDAVSVTDAGGVVFTLFVDRHTHLPSRLEQLVVGSAVGDSVDVVQFSDYRRVGALLLPYRRDERRVPDVRWEYRTVRFELDKPIADSVFAIPPGLGPTPPPSRRTTSLGPDVYLVPNNYQSVFVVFDDYVLVLEGGGSSAETQNTIARIKEVAPDKPIRYVVATHFHLDHLAGLRSFIAEGATIVTTADARAPIEALARVRYRLTPDALDRAPRAPVIEVVERERTFKDARHEVRLYQVGPSPHVGQMLVGYLPRERVLFEGDLLDIPNGDAVAGGDDTADFAAKVRALGLTFDRLIPVHGEAGTPADLEKSLRRGQARARCPPDAERRAPCNLDPPAEAPPPPPAGFSVREIPTRPESNRAHPLIVLPAPGGPHRVGRMTFHAVDSARKEVMTPDPADVREMTFHVWYPSDAPAGTRAAYLNVALQDSVFRRTVSFADTLARVRSSALVDVAVSGAARRYPVILFSHGLGTLSQTYTSFLENLASHGYVVVGVDHSYYSAAYTLPDGRSVRNLSRPEDRQRDVVAQAADLSFVVNVLERLSHPSASPAGRLAGRLDLSRLGVFGHSRGGFAAPHACRRDSRFKACANLDGYSMTPAVMDSGITQPFMMVEEIAPWDPPATDSQLVQLRWTRAQADSSTVADSSRREATFARMTGGAYLVVSPGAVHNSFSDFGVIVPQRFPLARQDFRRTIEITNAYLLAFFDTHLRGQSSALLQGKSARYPEVSLTVYRPGAAKQVFRGAPTWERRDRRR